MLVLTRALGEVIRVGEATVTVVRLGSGKVRLGIEAPAGVAIRRTELRAEDRPDGAEVPALPTGRARAASR